MARTPGSSRPGCVEPFKKPDTLECPTTTMVVTLFGANARHVVSPTLFNTFYCSALRPKAPDNSTAFRGASGTSSRTTQQGLLP